MDELEQQRVTCVSVFVRFRPWDHTTSGSPGLG